MTDANYFDSDIEQLVKDVLSLNNESLGFDKNLFERNHALGGKLILLKTKVRERRGPAWMKFHKEKFPDLSFRKSQNCRLVYIKWPLEEYSQLKFAGYTNALFLCGYTEKEGTIIDVFQKYNVPFRFDEKNEEEVKKFRSSVDDLLQKLRQQKIGDAMANAKKYSTTLLNSLKKLHDENRPLTWEAVNSLYGKVGEISGAIDKLRERNKPENK